MMEFELTIRGDASELPRFLELLGKDTGSSEPIDEEQASIVVYNTWTDESRSSFWEDISSGAKELMQHCSVHVGHDVVVDEDGLIPGRCTDNDCGWGERCWNTNHLSWEDYYAPLGITGDRLLKEHGWSVQSIGARLANITINLRADNYLGLPTPIHREALQVDDEGFKVNNYQLDPEWARLAFEKWENHMKVLVMVREVKKDAEQDRMRAEGLSPSPRNAQDAAACQPREPHNHK